jgi:LuxR family transcriptional regulator, maltose regulon positive regulatory protein
MFLIDSSTELRKMKMELILEKIAMPLEFPRTSRFRLLNILEQSLASCTSTVVCGRAGTGKTALVLDFARRCGRSVAWYKVDAPDAEIKVFFRYLIASIQKCRPGFGVQTLLPLVSASQIDEIPLLAEAFVYELAEGEAKPLLIVVDDLHLVCDASWLVPFFRRVLPLLPSEVHMMITSRSMPPAPLWRMRSKQTLSVIDEETLAFTAPEAIALFESYSLSSEQASIALDHTHGRAAALARSAASLEGERQTPNFEGMPGELARS